MASYTSQFSYPDSVHYLTLDIGDYEMTDTYGEPLSSSQEGFGFLYPGPASYPTGGDVYQTSGPRNEYTTWPCIESYFNSYWGEDRFPHGAGFNTSEPPYGSGFMDKAEEAYLGEVHHGNSNYSYDNDVEMQPGFAYISWFRDEYGSEEDFHDHGNIGVGWDEKKLCESIFGYWPCLLEQNLESYVEERLDSDLSTPMSYF